MKSQLIPLTRPNLDREEIQAVARVIDSKWLIQGPEVEAFEKEFASFVGAPFACAVSNGTTALHLALLACDIGPGDEVITVSHSFIATANSIRYCKAIPVFVDIENDTYNIDAKQIENAITDRTKAILCVHQLGMPSNLKDLLMIASSRGIPLIEDAACAVGSEINLGEGWHRIGRPHGRIACFSFHPRKVLTTGEGGMITCSDPQINQRLRLLRNHGILRPANGSESFEEVGYNYRLTDIQASIGRCQLKKLPDLVSKRRGLANFYLSSLSGLSGLRLPSEPIWARTNWQSFCVVFEKKEDVERYIERAQLSGVSAKRGVNCAHREPAYLASRDSWRVSSVTNLGCSEKVQDCGVILPLYETMTRDEQQRVIQVIRDVLKEGK